MTDRHGGWAGRLVRQEAFHQQVVGAALPFRAGYAEAGGSIALWVHVDEQYKANR